MHFLQIGAIAAFITTILAAPSSDLTAASQSTQEEATCGALTSRFSPDQNGLIKLHITFGPTATSEQVDKFCDIFDDYFSEQRNPDSDEPWHLLDSVLWEEGRPDQTTHRLTKFLTIGPLTDYINDHLDWLSNVHSVVNNMPRERAQVDLC